MEFESNIRQDGVATNGGGASRSRYSAATLNVLSSMPSRNIGENTMACICERAKNSAHRRRWTSRGSSIRADVEQAVHGGVPSEGDNGRQQQLVSHLRRLPVRERMSLLRAMPLNLALKIELRKLAGGGGGNPLMNRRSPCCSGLYVHLVATWRLLLGALALLSSVRLWRTQLKRLAGRFGTPVLPYFLLLRTLVLLDLLLLLANGLFLVLPRALAPATGAGDNNSSLLHSHSALHLLTGGGYVANSVMFYGYYGNTLSGQSCGRAEPEANLSAAQGIAGLPVCDPQVVAPASYNTPLSYLFTITSGLFITCIILVYSISMSFGRRFRVFRSRGKLAANVFSSWDFNVTKETSVHRQSENISTQLKEWLSERMCCERGPGFVCERRRLLRARLFAWALCLASVFLSGLAVYHLAEHMHMDQSVMADVKADVLGESHLLVLPAVVSTINLLLPGLFHLVSMVERYDSPLVATYVSIFRNLLLKVCLLGVLCYHWLWRVPSEPERYGLQCWESFVGQELYRLILADFFCTLVHAFVGESLWRLFSSRVLKRRRRPAFDVSRHALELVYGQTLTWLGVFFAPLLPVVQLTKLLLLFYIKKSGLMLTCEAPRRPWRASHMTAVFAALLLCPSLLGATACLTYTVWTVKPSSACGPFRHSPTPLEGHKLLLLQTLGDGTDPKWLWQSWAFSHLVESPLILMLAAGVFLIVIYIHVKICDAQKRIIGLLEEQIVNQGYDKKFLINKLQAVYEDHNKDSSVCEDSPGGRVSLHVRAKQMSPGQINDKRQNDKIVHVII